MKVFKYLGLIFTQIIISLITIPLVLSIVDTSHLNNTVSSADSISLANTFMVFVTFIVVVGTVAITIVGIYYTSWFSKQKEAIIKDNINEVTDALLNNIKLKEEVLNKIIKEPKVNNLLEEYLDNLRITQKSDFDSEIVNINDKINSDITNLEIKVKAIIDKKLQDLDSSKELQELLKGQN